MKMVHTSSSISCFLECPQKHKYNYVDMLDKYSPALEYSDSVAMSTGSLLHQVLHKINKGQPYSDLLKTDDILGLNVVDLQKNKVSAMVRARLFCEEELKYPYPFPVVEKEIILSYTLENTQSGGFLCDYKLEGMLDAIVMVGSDFYVLDHKTSERTPTELQYKNSLQQKIYCLMAHQNGYPVKGYIIDFWRVPSPRKHDGENEMFKEIVDITTRQKEETLQGNKTPYFQTFVFDTSIDQLLNFQKELEIIVQHIEGNRVHRNYMNCINRYGSRCEWYGLCYEGVDESLVNKRDILHVELIKEK